MDVAELGFRADSRSLRAANSELDRLSGTARRTETATERLNRGFDRMRGLLVAIGTGATVRALAGVEMQMRSLQSTFTVALGTAERGALAFGYVRSEANRLGLDLQSSARAFASLQAAAKGTSLEGEQAARIFTGVSEAATALGLDANTTEGALLALQQMISKGVVAAEELRGQLGERLPGAFGLAAEAMGMTTAELGKALQAGEVMAEDLLPKLADALTNRFGKAAVDAADSLTANVNRMRTAFFDLGSAINEAGALSGISAMVEAATMLAQQVSAVSRANQEAFGNTDPLLQWGEAFRAVIENAILFFGRIPDFVKASAVLIVADIVYMAEAFRLNFEAMSVLGQRAFVVIRGAVAAEVAKIIALAADMGDSLAKVFDALGADDIARSLRGASTAVRGFGEVVADQAANAIKELDAEREAIIKGQKANEDLRRSVRDQVAEELVAREAARRAALDQVGALDAVGAAALGAGSATTKAAGESEAALKAAKKAAKEAAEEYQRFLDAVSEEAGQISAADEAEKVTRQIERQIELAQMGFSIDRARAIVTEDVMRDQIAAATDEHERRRLIAELETVIAQRRLDGIEEARAASERALDEAQRAWDQAAQEINRSLTDALLRGFEDGKGFAENFRDTLKNMFSTLVLRPLIEPIMAPISGVIQSALGGGIPGGASALGGLIPGGASTALAGFGGGLLPSAATGISGGGFTVGNTVYNSAGQIVGQGTGAMIGRGLGAAGLGYLGGSTLAQILGLDESGQTGAGIGGALGAGLGSIVPGIGTLLGGAIGSALGGVVGSAFGGGSWGTDDLRLAGAFDGSDFDGSLTQFNSKKLSAGRGRRRRQVELDAEPLENVLSDLFGEVFAGGTRAAESLGLAVGDFAYEIDESLLGLEGDALTERILEIVDGAADALSAQILPGIENFQQEGETLSQTLARLSATAMTVDQALAAIDQSLDLTQMGLVEATQELINLFGGVDQFSASLSSYYDKFFTEAEREQRLIDSLRGSFEELGYSLPGSRDGFRDIVEGLDLTTASGREAFAALMGLSDGLDQIISSEDARRAAQLAENQAQIDARRTATLALQIRVMEAEGNAIGALALRRQQELDATEESLHGFLRHIYALEDQAAAADLAAQAAEEQARAAEELARIQQAIATERGGLERELLTLQGDTAALRALERAELFEQNRELYDRIQALRDEQAATEEASRAADELAQANRTAAQEALNASQRQLELARSNVSRAYDAEIASLQSVVNAVSSAESALGSARSALSSAYQREASEIQATINQFDQLAQALGAFRGEIGSTIAVAQGGSLNAARALFDAVSRRARLGDADALGALPGAGQGFAQASLAGSSSQIDYIRDLIRIQREAGEAQGVAERQKSIAEQQLDSLNAQAERMGVLNESVLSVAEATSLVLQAEQAFEIAQQEAEAAAEQISELEKARDQLLGIDTSVLSVRDSIIALQLAEAQNAIAIANAVRQGIAAAAALASAPGFASGGMHAGGFRWVGENGPELEYTGPSRIFSNSDSMEMASNDGDQETKLLLRQVVKNTGKLLNLNQRWDGNGLPETRNVA
ncbi:tape measure protein [Panacagrimonas sp.]|uniref:tape measure protein n=1 Tax=Panacagrimonas sp. TaxID=2480088 RepID=UPI003B52B300